MWIPILRQNKENVLDALNEYITQLRNFKSALKKNNYDDLEELIRMRIRFGGYFSKKSEIRTYYLKKIW